MRRLNRIERLIALTALTLGLAASLTACDSDDGSDIEQTEDSQPEQDLEQGEPPNVDPSTRLAGALGIKADDVTELEAITDGCGDFAPGELWSEGCNLCTCEEDGTALCTQMACTDAAHEVVVAGATGETSPQDAHDLAQFVPEPPLPPPPIAKH